MQHLYERDASAEESLVRRHHAPVMSPLEFMEQFGGRRQARRIRACAPVSRLPSPMGSFLAPYRVTSLTAWGRGLTADAQISSP
jgi:hypothetical protein